jgi:hypothetical protein
MSNDKQTNAVEEAKTAALDEVPVLVANRFTPDAQDRVARLRAMAAEFPEEKDPRPLTPSEIRLIRITTPAALEKAALFAEASPNVSSSIADVVELREAIAFELAYGGLRDEATSMARRIDHAIMRRKLKAVRAARGLYRIAKAYVTTDTGDPMRTHLGEMKRTLVRPPRRKRNAKTEPPLTDIGTVAKK